MKKFALLALVLSVAVIGCNPEKKPAASSNAGSPAAAPAAPAATGK